MSGSLSIKSGVEALVVKIAAVIGSADGNISNESNAINEVEGGSVCNGAGSLMTSTMVSKAMAS